MLLAQKIRIRSQNKRDTPKLLAFLQAGGFNPAAPQSPNSASNPWSFVLHPSEEPEPSRLREGLLLNSGRCSTYKKSGLQSMQARYRCLIPHPIRGGGDPPSKHPHPTTTLPVPPHFCGAPLFSCTPLLLKDKLVPSLLACYLLAYLHPSLHWLHATHAGVRSFPAAPYPRIFQMPWIWVPSKLVGHLGWMSRNDVAVVFPQPTPHTVAQSNLLGVAAQTDLKSFI